MVVHLSNKAKAEIAYNNDWGKEKFGYVYYDSAFVVDTGSGRWLMAQSESYDGYLSEYFCGDIVAIPIDVAVLDDEQLSVFAKNMLSSNDYFVHSLIYAMSNGQISFNHDGDFKYHATAALGACSRKYIVQEAKRGEGHAFSSTLVPVIDQPALYDANFVDFLCEKFLQILAWCK